LNPLSRTAQKASITIVDNIVRAAPKLVEITKKLKEDGKKNCKKILANFDNKKNLSESIALINERLSNIAKERKYLTLEDRQLDL
jgi:4-phosphopantoate--beta-alanine ligase